MVYFTAETVIRQVLNRTHNMLYSSDNWDLQPMTEAASTPGTMSVRRLLSLSSELNFQLEAWYHSMPSDLRPPTGTEHIANDRAKILRIRYYAARHIIHRPFILYVANQYGADCLGASSTTSTHGTMAPIPSIILEKCEMCISSCRNYLFNVVEMLGKRTPYLWTFSQNSLACLLVLYIADSIPQLRPFAAEIKPLQAMILESLRPWATRGSSFEATVDIIESLKIQDTYSTMLLGGNTTV